MVTRLLSVVVIAAVVLLLWHSLFSVAENEVGVVSHDGHLQQYGPGLHWQSPLDDVRKFDRRVVTQSFSANLLMQDGQAVNAAYFVSWRLNDAARYLQSVGGSEDRAGQRLSDVIGADLKSLAATQPLVKVVALPGAALPASARDGLNSAAAAIGVELVDVQLRQLDLTDEEATALYQRMQQSLVAQAQQLRAAAMTDSSKVRTDADKQRAEIEAEGSRQAQHTRAQADASAAEAYARAYTRNPEFAAFYRSMQAYKSTLGRDGDILVISPEGEFFKYLHSASGR